MTSSRLTLAWYFVALPIAIDAWLIAKPVLNRGARTSTEYMHVAAEQSFVGSATDDDPFRGISHLIDDGKGNIRSDLATSIWNWDNEHRSRDKLPKFEYSTRKGLRLVEETARELLETTRGVNKGVDEDHTVTTYSDLIQEGVVALMYAMAKYTDSEEESFRHYARRCIVTALTRYLGKDSRSFHLPTHVVELLKHARRTKAQLQTQMGREPTLAQVAEKLDIPMEKLQLYQLVSGSTLSVERTMEIYDPLLETTFADQDTWEHEHGEEDEENDDGLQQEGEDEMWVHQEQIAAPLRDMIPDTSALPDELIYRKMIHDDVNEFLVRTLDERELQVIRMRYGLSNGKVTSLSDIGSELGVTASRIKQIEEQAMEKLRSSYTNRAVEPYLEDEHGEETRSSYENP
jgi:RNA polymerase sigma factor (sigma-70 family)